MAEDGAKSTKSGDESQGVATIWMSKTIEEIEAEMDKARERIDKIQIEINKIRADTHNTQMAIKKLSRPLEINKIDE